MRCSAPSCNYSPSINCTDCNKDYCHEHFHKHNGRSKRLDDEIFELSDEVNVINPKILYDKFHSQIEQERVQSLMKVQKFYDEQVRKLEETLRAPGRTLKNCQDIWEIHEARGRVDHSQMDEVQRGINEAKVQLDIVRKLNNEQIFVLPKVYFSNEIAERKVEVFPHVGPVSVEPRYSVQLPIATGFEARTSLPLQSSINVENRKSKKFSFPSNYRIFNCSSQSGVAMGSSDELALFVEKNGLVLLNRNLAIVRSKPWPWSEIIEINWLEKLNQFLIVVRTGEVFVVNPADLNNAERVENIERENWNSAASSDRFLYLSTENPDPIVAQFDLLSGFKMTRRFRSPFLCEPDEIIHQIRTVEQQIIIVIFNLTKKTARFDVRSLPDFRLVSSSSIEVPAKSLSFYIGSCVLSNEQLLFFFENQRDVFFYDRIYRTGEFVDHKKSVCNAIMLGPDKLVVRTEKFIIIYPV